MRRAARPRLGQRPKEDKSRLFAHYWRIVLPDASEGEAEYLFHSTRQWRFDWAMPDVKVAVEVEGGVWVQGGHTRGKGYTSDLEKYAEAAAMDWLVFRFTPQMLETDPQKCIEYVTRALALRKNGIKSDNRPENILLGTTQENTMDHNTARLMAMYWREKYESLVQMHDMILRVETSILK